MNATLQTDSLRSGKRTDAGADVIAAAEAMTSSLRERAVEADRQRRVPVENIRAMQDAGLFHIFLPKAYGGMELGPHEHAMVTLALGRGCASTAWIFSLLSATNMFAFAFPKEAQDDIWAKNNYSIICSSTFLNPNNKATRVPGGYRLTGKWGYLSGCDFASWVMLNTRIDDNKTGHFFLVPRHETKTVDDWFTSGMRGTGSKSLTVTDLFVPEHRVVPADDTVALNKHRSLHPTFDLLQAGSRFYGIYMLAGVAAAAAQGAVEFFAETGAGMRRVATPHGGELKLSEQDYVATQFAEASGQLDLALFKIREGSRAASVLVKARRAPTLEEFATDARDNAVIARIALRSVSAIHSLIGAKACFEDHPVSRAKRDIEMITNHVSLNWRQLAVNYMAAALGSANVSSLISNSYVKQP